MGWLSMLPSECIESVCDMFAKRLQSEITISKVSRFLVKAHSLWQSSIGLVFEASAFSVGIGLQTSRGILRLDAGLVFSSLYTAGSVSL